MRASYLTLSSMETPREDSLVYQLIATSYQKINPKALGNPWLQLWLERMKTGRKSLLEAQESTEQDLVGGQQHYPAPNKKRQNSPGPAYPLQLAVEPGPDLPLTTSPTEHPLQARLHVLWYISIIA